MPGTELRARSKRAMVPTLMELTDSQINRGIERLCVVINATKKKKKAKTKAKHQLM